MEGKFQSVQRHSCWLVERRKRVAHSNRLFLLLCRVGRKWFAFVLSPLVERHKCRPFACCLARLSWHRRRDQPDSWQVVYCLLVVRNLWEEQLSLRQQVQSES